MVKEKIGNMLSQCKAHLYSIHQQHITVHHTDKWPAATPANRHVMLLSLNLSHYFYLCPVSQNEVGMDVQRDTQDNGKCNDTEYAIKDWFRITEEMDKKWKHLNFIAESVFY